MTSYEQLEAPLAAEELRVTLNQGIANIRQIEDDQKIIFDLGGSEYAPGCAKAELRFDPNDPETIVFHRLKVQEDFRDMGLGSMLFDFATSELKSRGYKNIFASLANEKTAHMFSRFPEENLLFTTYNPNSGEYERLNTDLKTVEHMLSEYRRLQCNHLQHDDDELPIHIAVEAKL